MASLGYVAAILLIFAWVTTQFPGTFHTKADELYGGCIPDDKKDECVLTKRVGAMPKNRFYQSAESRHEARKTRKKPGKVAIVGAGMAGLYAGLLLQREGIDFHIYEVNKRVGGQIYTYYFNKEKTQFFEAGANSIAVYYGEVCLKCFIDYLNRRLDNDSTVQMYKTDAFDYNTFIYFNGIRKDNGQPPNVVDYSKEPFKTTGFTDEDKNKKLSQDYLRDLFENYRKDDMLKLFDQHGPQCFLNCDKYTLRSFMIMKKGWSDEKVDYIESLSYQTNAFETNFITHIKTHIIINDGVYFYIKGGLSRLPEACQKIIGDDHITLGARVFKIESENDKVTLHYTQKCEEKKEEFDAVILALAPPAIGLIDRPRFSKMKEKALRSLKFEAQYKIGLQFKTRFWEGGEFKIPFGAIKTDLPSGWFFLPDFRYNKTKTNDTSGIIMSFSWGDDTPKWRMLCPIERERVALHDLAELFGKDVVESNFVQARSFLWYPSGFTSFHPGAYKNLIPAAREPETNIFFAGEYLGKSPGVWDAALESALYACRQLLDDPELKPL